MYMYSEKWETEIFMYRVSFKKMGKNMESKMFFISFYEKNALTKGVFTVHVIEQIWETSPLEIFR